MKQCPDTQQVGARTPRDGVLAGVSVSFAQCNSLCRMADVSTPEAAIRSYLTYLTDPGSLIDSSAVARLEADAARPPTPSTGSVRSRPSKAPRRPPTSTRRPSSPRRRSGPTRRASRSVRSKRWASRARCWSPPASSASSRAERVVASVELRRWSAPSPGAGEASSPTPWKRACLALDSPFSVKDVSERVGERDHREGRPRPPGGSGQDHGRRGAAEPAGRASKTWAVAAAPR